MSDHIPIAHGFNVSRPPSTNQATLHELRIMYHALNNHGCAVLKNQALGISETGDFIQTFKHWD